MVSMPRKAWRSALVFMVCYSVSLVTVFVGSGRIPVLTSFLRSQVWQPDPLPVRRQRPRPVLDPRADMPRHGPGGFPGVAVEQGPDDGQVLARLLAQSLIVVAGRVPLPGHVAEGAEQRLQP